MAKTKILITVKTYPTLSDKYNELVCTAGFREDGTWIRIYPIPFRQLEIEKQYKKYDWLEVDIERRTSDFRPESYKPVSLDTDFNIIGHIDTVDNWRLRKQFVFKKVYTNISTLIADAKDKSKLTSLAVFKPKEIIEFIIEDTDREWDPDKIKKLKANALQFELFKESDNPFEIVNKIPYKFFYKFIDENNRESTLMIEDWEIGALYWNSLNRHEGDEIKACNDIKTKYFENFVRTKDLYLFLGTTRAYHKIAPNPFIIIGVFYPEKETNEPNLFSELL